MSEPITPTVSARICQHMNQDHAEAVALYAKVFGSYPAAEKAEMLAIEPQGMDLSVTVEGKILPIRITFERPLKDAEDAHYTLIEMVKQARKMSSK